jgi:hypothetical protein
MARKQCPQCKRVTGASASTCGGCGRVFAALSLMPSVRAKRCVQCGTVNPGSVERCQCGFDLDVEPAAFRSLVLARRRHAQVLICGSLVIGALGILLFTAAAAMFGAVSFAGLIAVLVLVASMFRSGVRILGAARANLDDLDGASDVLPRARLR